MRQLLRIYRYARPHRFAFAVVFALHVLGGLFGTVQPLITGFIIDGILIPSSTAYGRFADTLQQDARPSQAETLDDTAADSDRPRRLRKVLRQPITHRLLGFEFSLTPLDWLLSVLVFLIAFSVFSGVHRFVETYLGTWTSERSALAMRTDFFHHLQELSVRFFDTHGTGQVMDRVMHDCGNLNSFLTGATLYLFRDVIMMVWMLVILLSLNWVLALFALAILPPYVVTNLYFAPRLRRGWEVVRQKYGDIYGTLYESVAGAKVVKAFGREKREERRAFHSLRQTYQLQLRVNMLEAANGSILGLVQQLGAAIVLWWGGRLVLLSLGVEHGFTLGQLVVFQGFLWRMYGPLMNLAQLNTQIQSAMVSAERVFGLMDSQATVERNEGAPPMPPIQGRVALKEVKFSFDPENPVWRGITFEVQPGSVVALVGPSGCGKTTVINLIVRFYDPVDGTVLIDDIDIRQVQLRSLRDQIGVVMQESILFGGSVLENIRYGRPDATDQDVVRAAIDANAHGFIVGDLSEGYETDVGERGGQLSGGQKQRIDIARTILRDPRLLILDEATSALDTESEATVQEALKRLMKGRTTFVIAHRLSTVMDADVTIVMRDGRIEEMGSHAELVAKGGRYSAMYKKHFHVQDAKDDWLR